MQNNFFVVDALNICKETSSKRARLTILLSLLLELKKKGHDFLCVFDESAYSEFKKQGADILKFYEGLTRNYESHFSKIRGKADDKILTIANKENCPIISNDFFSEYRPKYTWLKDPDRIIKVSVVRGIIFSEGVGIETDEIKDLDAVWNELESLLNEKPKPTKTRQTSVKPKVVKSSVKPKLKPEPKPEPEPEPAFAFSSSAPQQVVPIPANQIRENEPIKGRTQSKTMSMQGNEIINQLLEGGFITPDIAQILQHGINDQVTVVKTRKNELVAVILVIDKSGSMQKWQDAVIEGQKVMIQGLLGASPRFDVRFGQILFNDEVEYFQEISEFRDEKDSKKTHPSVKILDANNYRPSGFTALYDAILKGVCSLTPIIYAMQEQGVALETRVCILTDGMDEGAYGSGSKIPPEQLGKAIKYMLEENLINEISLAGIGSFDFRQVGKDIGIDTVVEIPALVTDDSLTDEQRQQMDYETKKNIRRTFNMWSKTGRTK